MTSQLEWNRWVAQGFFRCEVCFSNVSTIKYAFVKFDEKSLKLSVYFWSTWSNGMIAIAPQFTFLNTSEDLTLDRLMLFKFLIKRKWKILYTDYRLTEANFCFSFFSLGFQKFSKKLIKGSPFKDFTF